MAKHFAQKNAISCVREIGSRYGVDDRSLAVFRIMLGVVLVIDLVRRFGHSGAMYSDRGIFSRSFVMDSIGSQRWSVLFLNGSQTFVNLFLLFGILVAVAFTLGWKTRIVTVVMWIVIVSLHYRNIHLQNGADTLIRVTLFWAMFLPLGRSWSLDSAAITAQRHASRTTSSHLVVSVATFALIAQNAIMYLFTAILKSGPRWQEEGSALYYALGARQITTGFGELVFQHTPIWILTSLTFGTLLVEFLLPVMILLPLRSGWLRTTAVFLLIALHIGILLTMTVGFFPVVSIAVGVAVLPAWFWENVAARVSQSHQVSALKGRLLQIPFPSEAWSAPKAEDPIAGSANSYVAVDRHAMHVIYRPHVDPDHIRRIASNTVCAVALVMVLMWNLQSVTAYKAPQPVQQAMITTGLYQSWSMFAPGPPTVSSWSVVVGVLDSGERVDLLVPIVANDMSIQQDVEVDQRDNVAMQDKYWRKFFQSAQRNDENLRRFAAYACRSWNAENSGENHLKGLAIYQGRSRTLEEGERSKPVFDQLGSWKCT